MSEHNPFDAASLNDFGKLEASFKSLLAPFNNGFSQVPFIEALQAWSQAFSQNPEAQIALWQAGLEHATDVLKLAQQSLQSSAQTQTDHPTTSDSSKTAPSDPRFAHASWEQFPFNVLKRQFQATEALTQQAMHSVEIPANHVAQLQFMLAQWLEAISPSNYLATNPELLELTRAEGGDNLMRGARNLIEDTARVLQKAGVVGSEQFVLGENVAATAGEVIYQNALIELIQYTPATDEVYAKPILIVPAWIMKYYILDLSQKNSLVKFLVDQGHTVFMISWKNPTAEDRDLGMDDYLDLGVGAALEVVGQVIPSQPIHAVGYCIGGTLLSIAAARMAKLHDERLASVTLFAAQTDFSEPGELSLFISESQLSMLSEKMRQEGVLESSQMGGAFQMLRPRDLIWSPLIKTYLKGQRDSMIDLMAWNADGTRMPYRMHTEYLYRLYLRNELSSDTFPVHGETVSLKDIRVPLFVVGTETDHVAPWRSVVKVARLVDSEDFTFLLTSGGHNAGIISGRTHPKRTHRVLKHPASVDFPDMETWVRDTPVEAGSWWPVWQQWLVDHGPEKDAPPAVGDTPGYPPLRPAPGEYVKQR
jgi:polyhydroxyalkanoate synthase